MMPLGEELYREVVAARHARLHRLVPARGASSGHRPSPHRLRRRCLAVAGGLISAAGLAAGWWP